MRFDDAGEVPRRSGDAGGVTMGSDVVGEMPARCRRDSVMPVRCRALRSCDAGEVFRRNLTQLSQRSLRWQ